MGQIVGGAAKPKRCNINQLSQLGTPAAGEHILVSSDNSMNAAGQGNFDCYIVGDGRKAATALELKNVVDDTLVNQLRQEVTDLDMVVNGGTPVYSIERTFPAGQAISVGNKIDFSLPKGKYNLVSSKSISHGISIYFYDADGNAVKPTDNTSYAYNSLNIPNYTTRNPFDFPSDVVKIAFYSGSAPASDMDVSLVATSISAVAGLKDKVSDIEGEVNTLSGTIGTVEENVSDIGESVETLDVQINGAQNVIEFSNTFPSGTNISPSTKYNLVFPSGKYNLVTSKSSEAVGLTMYFYDSEGNVIEPTDKNNRAYSGISLPNYASLNPYDFSANVAKVSFYSGQVPEADVLVTFEATAISPVVGLESRVQNLETGMEDAEGDISGLDERVTALEGGGGHKVVSYTCTELSQLTISDGYWWNGEHSSNDWSYFAVENLKEGDVLIVASHSAQAILMRFVDTYNGNTRVSGYADNSSYRRIVRVPSGVDKVYITIPRNAVGGPNFLMRGTFVDGSPASINNNTWMKSADSLSENAELVLGDGGFQVRKNQVYDVKCRFSTFSSVMFGQGLSTSKEGRVEVDSTNVKVFIRGEASPIHNSEHGLTITSFLFVTISVKYSGRGSLVLVSDSGTYTVADFAWGASAGDIKFVPGMAVTDVSLSYASQNLLNDVWMFGDSYMSFANNREPHYLHEVYGAYDDVLSSGYSGAGSADCVTALLTYLQITRPKYIVWLAGMNDQDTSTEASRTWLDSVNFARDVCQFYGAKLILATIPNVPSIRHTFKNAIVKASPEQYIDLANAVGAEEEGSTWNPSAGLSEDNVHPSILGAQLLAAQIVLDFPQIFRTK